MTSVPPAALATPGPRIRELDVLRGFALCGILVVNIYQQLVWVRGDPSARGVLPPVVDLVFYERFMPIFAMLFGVGFGLFLDRAAARTDRPRTVLARRLAVLLVLGALHQVVHVGEALLPYAVVGLVVLIPMSFLGPRACLVTGIVLVVLLPQIQTSLGLLALLPLGFGLARVGVPAGLARHPGRVAAAVGISATVVAAWSAAHLAGVRLPVVSVVGSPLGGDLLRAAASVSGAIAYSGVVLLALRTPLGPVLDAVLAPMGRMALTNYLSATVLFLTIGPLLGIDAFADGPAIAGLTVGILVAQALGSRAWLTRFVYGPVEWVWRSLTWGRRAPVRRAA